MSQESHMYPERFERDKNARAFSDEQLSEIERFEESAHDDEGNLLEEEDEDTP